MNACAQSPMLRRDNSFVVPCGDSGLQDVIAIFKDHEAVTSEHSESIIMTSFLQKDVTNTI